MSNLDRQKGVGEKPFELKEIFNEMQVAVLVFLPNCWPKKFGRLKETDRVRNTLTDGLHHRYPDVT
jgi:hypothetical protein